MLQKVLPGIALFCMISCSSNKNQTEEARQELPVHGIQEREVVVYKNFPVTIEGQNDIEVRSMVTGYLDKIYVDEGEQVSKNTPLFKIDDRIYKQRYNQAEALSKVAAAKLQKAEIEFTNAQELFRNNVISETQKTTIEADYALSKAEYEQAVSALDEAKTELEYTVITAASDGVVGKIEYRIGGRITPESAVPLTQLSDIRNVYTFFFLSEREYMDFMENGLLEIGTPVALKTSNNRPYPHKGKINAVNGLFEKRQGNLRIRAVFPNEDQILRSGTTGMVEIPVLKGTRLTVPKKAIFKRQNKYVVYKVDSSDVLKATVIDVMDYDADNYIVTDGLNIGDRVLVSGLDRVTEDEVIKPIMEK